MTVVGFTGEVVPRNQSVDEQWFELTGCEEVPGQSVNVLPQRRWQDESGGVLVVDLASHRDGGHEVARIRNRQPHAAQQHEVVGFDAAEQTLLDWSWKWHCFSGKGATELGASRLCQHRVRSKRRGPPGHDPIDSLFLEGIRANGIIPRAP